VLFYVRLGQPLQSGSLPDEFSVQIFGSDDQPISQPIGRSI